MIHYFKNKIAIKPELYDHISFTSDSGSKTHVHSGEIRPAIDFENVEIRSWFWEKIFLKKWWLNELRSLSE